MDVKTIARQAYRAGTGEDLIHPPQPARNLRAAYTSRQTATLIGLLSIMSGLVVAWWASQPSDVHAVPPPVEHTVLPTSQDEDKPEVQETVVVYVSGHVINPGVLELESGMRLADAIELSGGFSDGADTEALNLARVVVDGEHIHVPAPGEAPPVPVASESSHGLININTATSEQLQELPGVGPAMAEKIMTHRETIGRFTAVDELLEISGIGPATLDKMRDHVTL